MKKQIIIGSIITLMCIGMQTASFAGETSLAGYATYLDGGENGGNDGVGFGVKVRQKFLGFFSADIRGGYMDFNDLDSSVIPIEGTVMIGIPFIIEPYAGLGAGYYFVDTDIPSYEDGSGVYALLGAQLNLWVVGAFAEIRYTEAELDLMDGVSVNLGLMVKW